jgi:hypothetical protein
VDLPVPEPGVRSVSLTAQANSYFKLSLQVNLSVSTTLHPTSITQYRPPDPTMDTAIDLSDASKALDLANIRFQLM